MGQSILKHWHLNYRHWGITQKKADNKEILCSRGAHFFQKYRHIKILGTRRVT
jgi:hypothetical protein